MQVFAKIFSSLGKSSPSLKASRAVVAASMAFLRSAAGVLVFTSLSSREINREEAPANGEPKIPSFKYWRILL